MAEIKLTAGLNISESVKKLNSDIEKINGRLKYLRLIAKLDDNAKAEIEKQIKELSTQKRALELEVSLKTEQLEKQIENIQSQHIQLDIDTSNAAQQIDNMSSSIGETNNAVTNLGRSFNTDVKDSLMFISARQGLQMLKQFANEAVDAVKEYDKYSTNIQMITGMSDSEADNYISSLADKSIKYRVDISDLESAAETLLRTGKTVEEVNILLEDSIMLAKTGFQSANESAESLVTIGNIYKINASEMADTASAFVTLDSAANTTAAKLSDAIAASASNAKLAGINIQQLSGMIAGLRDVSNKTESQLATSLNAMFSRLGNVKLGKYVQELEDGTTEDITEQINNTEKLLNALDMSLRTSRGEFRETDELLQDLADHWEEFNGVTKSAVASTIAGERHRNVFISLMENYEHINELSELAINSAGKLEEKYSSYMESIEAKSASFSTAAKEMFNNLIPDDFVGNVTDAGAALIQFVDSHKTLQNVIKTASVYAIAKGFVTVKGSITDTISSIRNVSNAFKTLDDTIKTGNMNALGQSLKGLDDKQLKLILSTKNLTTAQKVEALQASGMGDAEAAAKVQTLGLATAETTATTATFSLSGSLKGLFSIIASNPIGLLVTAAGALFTIMSEIERKEEEAIETTKELAEKTRTEIDELYKLYDAYKDAKEAVDNGTGSKESLTTATETLIDKIGIEREELHKLIQEYGNLDNAIKKAVADDIIEIKLPDLMDAVDVAGKELTDNIQDSFNIWNGGEGGIITGLIVPEDISEWLEEWNKKNGNVFEQDYHTFRAVTGQALDDLMSGKVTNSSVEAIRNYIDIMEKLRSDLQLAGMRDTETYKEIDKELDRLVPLYDAYTESITTNNEQAAKAVKFQKDISEELPETYDEYIKYRRELLEYAQNDENINLFSGTAKDIENSIVKQLSSDAVLKAFENRFENLQELAHKYIGDSVNSGYEAQIKSFIEGLSDDELEIATQISGLFSDGLDSASAKIAQFKSNDDNKITTEDVIDIDLDLSEIIKANANKVKTLTNAMKDMNEQGYISSSVYAEIIEQGGNFAECLDIENGKIILNIEKYKALEAQELDNLITKNAYKMAALNEAKAHATNTEAINEEIAALERENGLYSALKKEMLSAALPETKTKTTTTKTTSTVDENKQRFEAELAKRQHWVTMGIDDNGITYSESDLYNWLNDANEGYRHYFSDLTKYQSEYWKYEEQVFKWEQQQEKEREKQREEQLKQEQNDLKKSVDADKEALKELFDTGHISAREYSDTLTGLNNKSYGEGSAFYGTDFASENFKAIKKIIDGLSDDIYKERLAALQSANDGSIQSEKDFVEKWKKLNEEMFKDNNPKLYKEYLEKIADYEQDFLENRVRNEEDFWKRQKQAVETYFDEQFKALDEMEDKETAITQQHKIRLEMLEAQKKLEGISLFLKTVLSDMLKIRMLYYLHKRRSMMLKKLLMKQQGNRNLKNSVNILNSRKTLLYLTMMICWNCSAII